MVLRLDVGDLGHQQLAGLGRSFQLGGIRRAADDLAGLRVERHHLALELGHLPLPLAALRLQALPARARFGGAGGELGEPHLGGLEGGVGRVVVGQRLLLEIGGEAGGVGERLGLGIEPRQRLLGLGDQRFLARQVAPELGDAAFELALAGRRALRLALQVVLLQLEAVQDGALGGLLLAQRLDLVGGLRLGDDGLGFGLRGAGRPSRGRRRAPPPRHRPAPARPSSADAPATASPLRISPDSSL